jgi:organic hydroperoxide reductase OsmC/OhrA
MPQDHHYAVFVRWTGNTGLGTSAYEAYERSHEIHVSGKSIIFGSSDPAFRGNPARHNPEEMLVAALSTCHMLWYLHLCGAAGVVVTAYEDQAEGTMEESSNGAARLTNVTLKPRVRITRGSALECAKALHHRAHQLCFIANSVNFPVKREAVVETEQA